jgi:HEAT repeat protein
LTQKERGVKTPPPKAKKPEYHWSMFFNPRENLRDFSEKGYKDTPVDIKEQIKKLYSSNRKERAAASTKLTDIGAPAIDALIDTLKVGNVRAKRQSSIILGDIGGKRAIESLVEVLKGTDYAVIEDAADALDNLGWQPSDQKEEISYLIARRDWDGLAKVGEPAIDDIIPLFRSNDYNLRTGAGEALNKMGEIAFLPLMEEYKSLDKEVKSGKKSTGSWKVFFEGMPDPDPQSRARLKDSQVAVLKALVKTKDKRVLDILKDALDNKHITLRKLAAEGLSEFNWKPSNDEEHIRLLIASEKWDELVSLCNDQVLDEDAVTGKLLGSMGKDYENVNTDVIRTLGKLGNPSALEVLKDIVKRSEYSFVRSAAISALENFKDILDIDTLLDALKDKGYNVRIKAATQLGERGDKRAVGALIETASDKDRSVRKAAVIALGKIGDPGSEEALVRVLKDKNVNVRMAAANALDNLGWKPLNDEENVYYLIAKNKGKELADIGMPVLKHIIDFMMYADAESISGTLTDPLRAIGEAAIEPLSAGINDESWQVRRNMIWAISRIDSLKTTPIFLNALADKDGGVRNTASKVLGKRAEQLDPEMLINMLSDNSKYKRTFAARELGNLKVKRAVEQFVPLLKDEDGTVRIAVMRSLGKIGGYKAEELLISEMYYGESKNKKEAINALGYICSAKAIRTLHDFSLDTRQEESMKKAAYFAYNNTGKRDCDTDKLVSALRDRDSEVRRIVALTLRRLGWKPGTDEEKLQFYIALQNQTKLAGLGEPAVEPLIALLDEDMLFKYNIIAALGSIGDKRAVEPLIPFLKDKDDAVRRYTAFALGKLKAVQVIDDIIAMLKEDNKAVKQSAIGALKEFGDPKAIQPLIDALDYDDADVRRNVIGVLGNYKDKRVTDALLRLITKEYPYVRGVAVNSLSQIADESIIKPFISLLDDEEKDIRRTAARTISGFKVPMDIAPLLIAIDSQDDYVRQHVVIALGNAGDREALRHLLPLLKDEDWKIREAAARALSRLGDPVAFNPLIEALGNKHYLVRKAAAEALSKVGEPAVIPMIKLLDSGNSTERRSAKEVLRRIGEPAVKPLIDKAVEEYGTLQNELKEIIAGIGAPAIKPLFAKVKEGAPCMRGFAYDILLIIGRNNKKALLPGLRDDDKLLRKIVASALRDAGWRPVSVEEQVEYLIAFENWRGIERMGMPAISSLIPALRYDDPEIAREAEKTIEKISGIQFESLAPERSSCLFPGLSGTEKDYAKRADIWQVWWGKKKAEPL